MRMSLSPRGRESPVSSKISSYGSCWVITCEGRLVVKMGDGGRNAVYAGMRLRGCILDICLEVVLRICPT